MLMHSQLITVEDQTSPGTLSATDLFNLVWGLNYQGRYHFGNGPWVNGERAPMPDVVLLPKDESGSSKPPEGAQNLILLDSTDQEGALGYHEDTQGNEIPFSEVFVKTAREDGVAASEVASHEMLEMLVDPDVNNVRTARNAGKLYILEVCDAVQGTGYDVGAPEGRTTGVIVANFCLPAWFGMPQPFDPHRMDFRSVVHVPFQLVDPSGYISIAPENEPNAWTQIFAAEHPTNELPRWASRLPKIHHLTRRVG
jgi:hypothetical protein